MNNSLTKTFSKGLFSLYVYYSNLLLGWQIVSFIFLYQSTNAGDISNRFNKWIVFEPYLIGIGALITIILLILHRIKPNDYLQRIPGLLKQVMIQNLFLSLLFFNYLTIKWDFHLDVFELGAFIFAIWILIKWGSVFYNTKIAGWMHPTTHGTFFVSAILIGCSLGGIFNLIPSDTSLIQYCLLILLIFELFIVYARFKYLSKFSQTTIEIARKLMGSQLFYFGTRIIIGIFMPAIFIIYVIFIEEGSTEGVAFLILFGTIIDRFLFINTGDIDI